MGLEPMADSYQEPALPTKRTQLKRLEYKSVPADHFGTYAGRGLWFNDS